MTRHIRPCIFLLAVLLVGCSETTHEQSVAEANQRWNEVRARVKLQLAQRAFDGGNLDDAHEQCAEALGLDGQFADGYVLMARIQLEQGHLAEAAATLAYAEPLQTAGPELYYVTGVVDERRGDPAAACRYYEIAYNLQPDELDYLLAYAESLVAIDRIDDALALLTSRQFDFEQAPSLHALTGQVLTLAGRVDEAADSYLLAVQLAPNDALLREEAVLTLVAAGRVAEAMLLIEPVLESTDGQVAPAVIRTLAAALLDGGRSTDAVRLLRRATARDQGDATLWLLLAKAQICESDHEAADAALARARALAPDRPEVLLLAAFHAMQTGRLDQAITLARSILDRNPTDLEARAVLASALEQTPDQTRAAIEAYDQILAIAPDNEWARSHLAALSRSVTIQGPPPPDPTPGPE
jgi:tetratricopeptide (TPR) repeat protein